MRKHFKTKRKLQTDIIIKYLLIILISYLIIRLCFLFVLRIPIIDLSFRHEPLKQYHTYIKNRTINQPHYFLSYYKDIKKAQNDKEILANYNINDKPLIYIYNTHQTEAYKDKKSVLDAAKDLKAALLKHNVDVIVEEDNITEFMRTNNISYNYSYYASKFYVKDALSKYQLDLIIDLHRDAVSKKATTVTIDKKDYAKIMFVIGKDHKNYKVNYALAKKLNQLIAKSYPTLTRGVSVKSGQGVNGIYNQDLSDKSILIELGGNQNTYAEVKNTIEIISKILGEYLYEERKNR